MSFALFLFLLLLVTGMVWALEAAVLRSRRMVACRRAVESLEPQLKGEPEEKRKTILAETIAKVGKEPWWVEYSVSFFPVILVVFLLRSFLYEPFKIPSGSMMPTLLTGDLILVNKFTYGLRLPVINTKITDGTPLARGDVVVFRYPPKPSMDYIKRVVGIPGDEVAYLNKKLTINGQPVSKVADADYLDSESMRLLKQYGEDLGGKQHKLLNDEAAPSFVPGASDFPFRENCRYSVEGVVCKVPAGNYFMMGDNRDNSADSRFWGFVPDKNIVGRAFFVWMNFSDLGRIGPFQ